MNAENEATEDWPICAEHGCQEFFCRQDHDPTYSYSVVCAERAALGLPEPSVYDFWDDPKVRREARARGLPGVYLPSDYES